MISKSPHSRPRRFPNLVTASVITGAIVGFGCMSRPIAEVEPIVSSSVEYKINLKGVDKVDLLFAIDNSASMADKQKVLGEAVPKLVGRLLNPLCKKGNGSGATVGPSTQGDCTVLAAGDGTIRPEFPAVKDLHVGIVSSALGPRGGYAQCNPASSLVSATNRHWDDKGHLIYRTKGATSATDGTPNAAAASNGGFLAFYTKTEEPSADARPSADSAAFVREFTSMVEGVQEYGCGFEAQLESVYRFLFQPDPYVSFKVSVNPANGAESALMEGVDKELLIQRKKFLRPDSLVAVIMVTDENESTADPLSAEVVNDKGYQLGYWFFDYGTTANPQQVAPLKNTRGVTPRGTSVCATDPMSPGCTSCRANSTDAACATVSPEGDANNARWFQTKRRFGYDPQFPLHRYVNAFAGSSSGAIKVKKVPNRTTEHTAAYQYRVDEASNLCTNPVYAAVLPDPTNMPDLVAEIDGKLCTFEAGKRDPSLVIFSLIGGVPWQLLTDTPDPATAKFKAKLASGDWTKMIGADPLKYDFTGADPHMLESMVPREGLLPPATAGNGADAIHGREYNTDKSDLQYACTFNLPAPKNCGPTDLCDCNSSLKNPPLCNGTSQIKAKAYPTVRELALARALDATEQSVVASICPITLAGDATLPAYGYNPAAEAIVGRLRIGLGDQCLPRPLAMKNGKAPCRIIETRGETLASGTTCTDVRRLDLDAETLARVRAAQSAADRLQLVCTIPQITDPDTTKSCLTSTESGWCYVTGPAALEASQCENEYAVKFSQGGLPKGEIQLSCILAN